MYVNLYTNVQIKIGIYFSKKIGRKIYSKWDGIWAIKWNY